MKEYKFNTGQVGASGGNDIIITNVKGTTITLNNAGYKIGEKITIKGVKTAKLKKDGKPKKSGGKRANCGRKKIDAKDKAVPMSISIKGEEQKKAFEEFKRKIKN